MQPIETKAEELIRRILLDEPSEAAALRILETPDAHVAFGVDVTVTGTAVRILRNSVPREVAWSLGAMVGPDSFADVCSSFNQNADDYSAAARG